MGGLRTKRTLAELAALMLPAGAAALAWPGAGLILLALLPLGWLLTRPVWAWRQRLARRLGLAVAAVLAGGAGLVALLLAGLVWLTFARVAGPGLAFGRLVLAAAALEALGIAAIATSERVIRPAAAKPKPGLPRPPFIDNLAPPLRGPLLALEMEDHYLRIHTANGSGRLFMRLRDATAQLGEADGALVHLSWWVARHAVAGVRQEGRAVTLQLINGLDVPVSRDRLPALSDAGIVPD